MSDIRQIAVTLPYGVAAAAFHALQSYVYGNSTPTLAEAIARELRPHLPGEPSSYTVDVAGALSKRALVRSTPAFDKMLTALRQAEYWLQADMLKTGRPCEPIDMLREIRAAIKSAEELS